MRSVMTAAGEVVRLVEGERRACMLRDFLPTDLLLRWAEACSSTPLPDPDGVWQYTTNEGVHKVCGNHDRAVRRARVEALRDAGEFAYSKWEPRRDSPLYREIRAYLAAPAALARLSAVVGEEVDRLCDLYLTLFEPGDFLTLHADQGLGRYAFTIALTSLAPDAGGELRLYAEQGAVGRLLHVQHPRANELTLFSIAPLSLPHEVVTVRAGRRAVIAGFLGTPGFEADPWSLRETSGSAP